MAKRIQFRTHGGPEVLEYVDFEPAAPGPKEVLVRNKAIGVNFIETYFRTGLYPVAAMPSGLGNEGAGVVEAVGAEVTHVKVGDRVLFGKWSGTEVKVSGEDLLIMKESDILGVIG